VIDEHRVEFDFELEFTNGGALQGQGFRLDIDGDDIADPDLAASIVADLRLLMVGEVRILNKRILRERHKRAAAASALPAAADGRVRIDLSHAGETYLESGRADIAALPLDRTADLDAVTVNLAGSERRAIERAQLLPYDIAGKAVLICAGAHVGGPPYLTADAAEQLAAGGALLVGVDWPDIDDPSDPVRPVHAILSRAGIPICRNLTGLAALPTGGVRFSAVPVKIHGVDSSPVRAYATLQER
jgi:kynurenine formamidase